MQINQQVLNAILCTRLEKKKLLPLTQSPSEYSNTNSLGHDYIVVKFAQNLLHEYIKTETL